MIIGVGIDIVLIARIETVLARHGKRFLDRIYTEEEQSLAARMPDPSGVLAKRWAAKEACSKALGTGMRQGVAWRGMGVQSGPGGMPGLVLTGSALSRLEELIPSGFEPAIHLSMSDDRPSATAMVVIEARPAFRPGQSAEIGEAGS